MAARSATGFTLVELLVSMAVLVLLIALILELFNSATATATVSRQHIDADEAARLVFDRMAGDFGRMVKRPDVNYIFYKNNAAGSSGSSDAMFFYSEAPGYLDPTVSSSTAATGGASTVSLVGYRINQNNAVYPGTPVMERLGETLTWAGQPYNPATLNPGGMLFLPATLAGNWYATIGTPPYLNQTTEHYQVLSDMVFRMEFCFLLKSGAYTIPGATWTTPATGYSNAPTDIGTAVPQPYVTNNYFAGATAPDYAGNVYGFPPDLGGIVVTIAVLDDSSHGMVSGSSLAKLGAALDDSLPGNNAIGNIQTSTSSPPAELTSQLWQNQIVQSGFANTAGVPRIVLNQLRIYERTFYLSAN
jgi:prepilin-type N-terminal cleavage/methylation domain-containing protein